MEVTIEAEEEQVVKAVLEITSHLSNDVFDGLLKAMTSANKTRIVNAMELN